MKTNLLNSEWTYIPPEEDNYKIILFDDGCREYKQYINNWKKFGKWRGKIALVNIDSPEIVIKSISAWKVERIINPP